jgi:hypothetical protein
MQHLPHRVVAAIEAGELSHGKGAFSVASWRETIDRQIEAGQLVQRTGEDADTLSAG